VQAPHTVASGERPTLDLADGIGEGDREEVDMDERGVRQAGLEVDGDDEIDEYEHLLSTAGITDEQEIVDQY
jgi:hypothetical protein